MLFKDLDEVKTSLRLRYLFRDKKKLLNSDVLIFHCPFDTALLKWIHKPSILYEHRAVRPYTFNFKNEIKLRTPFAAWRMRKERPKILKFFKEKIFSNPDVILTNSKFIQSQMKKYFNIDTFVVNPPIDTKRFHYKARKRDHFLSVQRIDWQKRPELQVEAFIGLKEKLFIVGPGTSKTENTMRLMVKPYSNIEYLNEVSEKDLIKLIQSSKAILQTSIQEDFGLVPVEAMACGIPSIVVDQGGFRETIHNPELGVRVRPSYVASLRRAVKNFNPKRYKPHLLVKEAQKYGFKRFNKQINYYINLAIKRYGDKKH